MNPQIICMAVDSNEMFGKLESLLTIQELEAIVAIMAAEELDAEYQFLPKSVYLCMADYVSYRDNATLGIDLNTLYPRLCSVKRTGWRYLAAISRDYFERSMELGKQLDYGDIDWMFPGK